MIIDLVNRTSRHGAFASLAAQLTDLGFDVRIGHTGGNTDCGITVVEGGDGETAQRGCVYVKNAVSLLEQALRCIPLDFDSLPLFLEGESKIIRSWTPRVLVERFKPTVYSFTHNRCGVVHGTDVTRARFTAEIFRRMARLSSREPCVPRSAFLGLVETASGPLVVQERKETCNLEVRVKRFHIGSPLHRYRYTDNYASTQACGPLKRWSRLDRPVVCFDWRNPFTDEQGVRLADEPLSDDYASVWMDNVPMAKEMARNAFLWLEQLFAAEDLCLIDMCMFVDRTGQFILGEISPDCMRVRLMRDVLDLSPSLDKDQWRQGAEPAAVAKRYEELYARLFGSSERSSSSAENDRAAFPRPSHAPSASWELVP